MSEQMDGYHIHGMWVDEVDLSEWSGWNLSTSMTVTREYGVDFALMRILTGFPRHKIAAMHSRKARRALLR